MQQTLMELEQIISEGDIRAIKKFSTKVESLLFQTKFQNLQELIDVCCALTQRIGKEYASVPVGYQKILNRLFDSADKLISGDSALYREFADAVSATADINLPWNRIRLTTRGLAVLYNFLPFADTGASVASKRLRQLGAKFDVISCSSLGRKTTDLTPYQISRPYIDEETVLPLTPAWGSWEPQARFIKVALDEVERFHSLGKKYDFIYTRAMWIPSHYVGAYQKFREPKLEWIAEFSDPLSLDVVGKPRAEHPPQNDDMFDYLVGQFEREFGQLPETERGIFRMAELLAYGFADKIIFTNELQRRTMLDHISNSTLRTRVESKSIVSNHPTLPRRYYEILEPSITPNEKTLNIGYFGNFYSSRGLTDITRAIKMLPTRFQNLLRLHIFTTFVPEKDGGKRPVNMSQKIYDNYVARTLNALGNTGLNETIVLHPSLPYLEFLSTLKQFDYLIVNDAESGEYHEVNPYLPSKYSDYKGSSSRIWAICEPGSCLDKSDVAIKTRLGDVNQVRTFLFNELSQLELTAS